MLLACGFESLQAHQTNMIRTCFQSVMGSDYCFSLTATKAPTSATGGGASPPPSREARGRRKQPHKRKKGGRSRLHGAPALFVIPSVWPSASPPPSASSIRLNLSFSMGLNFLAIVLAIANVLDPVSGALVHNAGSVLVIINSALLLRWKKR